MAAINKRKILESAQRNLQKGALDKALADYQTVLQADPRDTNVRLKVGDLLQKAGRNDEAIAAYLKVADQFQRDGFDAKAVALYKQVTKIDDKRHDVYVPLADLYQRLGLVSEAMAALQIAADAYHRDGRKREALELLRRMASLDPANVTSRLKVAELLKQEGLLAEAAAEFREAGAELDRQGDWEARAGVLERLVEVQPDCVDELEWLAAAWLDHGQPRRAHAFAQKLVEADASRPESLEILARVLSGIGQEELAIDAFRQCAEAWRVRGEDGKAREIVQRHLPPQDFASLATATPTPESSMAGGTAAAAELFGSAGELGAEPAVGEGVFGSEPLDLGAGGAVELGGEEAPFDPGAVSNGVSLSEGTPAAPVAKAAAAPAPKAAPAPAAKSAPAPAARAAAPAAKPAAPAAAPRAAATPMPGPEGDLDQHLAEAAVYARYGKHERALASLEAALAIAPDHGGALEQLGDVHAAAGAPERAVEAWTRAAEAAAEARDAARFAVLRGRIEAIDPAAAAALHAPVPAGAPAPTVLFEVSQPDFDEGEAGESLEMDAGGSAAADELDEIEIDVDDGNFPSEAASSDEAEPDAADAAAGLEIELDAADLGDVEAGEEDTASDASTPSSVGDAAAAMPDVGFDLDLEDDAAEAAAPPAPAVDEDEIVFDGEDAAALDEPAAEPEPEPEEPPAPRQEHWELPFDEDEEPAAAAPAAAPVVAAAAVPEVLAGDPHAVTPPPGELSVSAAQQIQEDFEEAGFYFEQGLLAEAEAIYRRILARAPSHPGALLRLGEIAVQRGAGAPAPAAAAPVAAAPPVEEAPEIEPPDALDLTAPTLDDESAAAWSGQVAPGAEIEDSTAGVVAPPAESFDDTTLRPTPAAVVAAVAATASAAKAPAPEEPELTTPERLQEESAGGAAFDLAAELSEAFSGAPTSAGSTGPGTDEDGFASLFREFKRGVSQTLGEGDVETHFDLGIAYREMGLLEDAIGEFRYALGSPARRLDALQLMGLCALDLGRAADAVGHLEQALASPEVPAEREAPLRYELGRAYEALPDRARALDAFRRVVELEPGFQDVAERVAALERGEDPPAPEPEESEEAFESFDDLVAEAAEDAAPAPPPAESFESFDDVVAEANDDEQADAGAGAPAVAEAALEAETDAALAEAVADDDPAAAEPEAEPQPAEPAAPAPRRRRKVSFF